MKLENLLAGFLAFAPATGYDLKKLIDNPGRFMRSSTQMSQVYRTLGAMEERGWVRHDVEPRPGATDAKRYHLTGSGEQAFLDWLISPYRPPSRFEDPELGARLKFAGFMSRREVLRILDEEIEVRTQEVSRYRDANRTLELHPSLPFDASLSEGIEEWAHRSGSAAKDAHIARVVALRDAIRDTPAGQPIDPPLPVGQILEPAP